MAKLKDIADAVGVSVSAVSKALGNKTDISNETREKILKAARELDYDFRPAAKNRADPGEGLIAVICPEVKSNYYTQLIDSIGEKVAKEGYRMVFAVTEFEPENEKLYLELFAGRGADGILLISENYNVSEIIDEAIFKGSPFSGAPLVLITNGEGTNKVNCLRIDDSFGISLGLGHLISLGHKKIGYIGDSHTGDRLSVFYSVMKAKGMNIEKGLIKTSGKRFEQCGYESMKEMLDSGNIPTAVFAAYDDIAVGAIKAIEAHGLSVPEDISVIGMDNIMICPYLHKELTTVSNPIREMASISCRILMKKITDQSFDVIQHVVLKPALVIRETTAAVKS
ncbi:MAG: LacI family DNA-binding transcriptional regulator [Eubacteriales bacterium]|nr:LacI family DNA-binding transcriptional regulator [Eubacteriales bacterium]